MRCTRAILVGLAVTVIGPAFVDLWEAGAAANRQPTAVIRLIPSPSQSIAKEPAAGKGRLEALPFALGDVHLLNGPFRDATLRHQKFLLDLDPDRLLHNFRINVGMPSSAKPLGGYEAPDIELRGHSVGHYLSAVALMYASTGDERFKARGDLIVAELAKVQAAAPVRGFNKGYLSAFPEEFFDRLEAGKKVWAPYYTMHKIMAGLLDMYRLCQNQQALEMLLQQADWVRFRQDRVPHDQQQAMLRNNEPGGMLDVLSELYEITGNPEHLRVARTFRDDTLVDALARHEDVLDHHHANSQLAKIVGVAREYEVSGDPRDRDVASFFWERVAKHRSFANGGNSDVELFFPTEEFSHHLGSETSETCNTYNMLKLTRHLFAWRPSAETMDFYERGLYNHILASQDPATGMLIYYCPLKPGSYKSYSTPDNSFWCCVGTGMENHSKYPDTIYSHDDRESALYVNLFIASSLRWKDKGLVVRQETRFPEEDTTRLSFTVSKPTWMSLKVRYPSWASSGFRITVNGTAEKIAAHAGSYVTVDRVWKNGDTVQVHVPMSLRLEPMPDNPNVVAVLYGPILLAGNLGKEDLDKVNRYGADAPLLGLLEKPVVPAFVAPEASSVLAGIKRVDGVPLMFRTAGIAQPHEVTLIPFYKAADVRYTVYWNTYTPREWERQEAEVVAADVQRNELERAVADAVDPNSEASEKAHNYRGEKAGQSSFEGRNGRGTRIGWFSYDLAVDPSRPLDLYCTYRRSENRPQVFDILVDGQKIATETIGYRPDELFEVKYSIPDNIGAGKAHITVRFQPQPESAAAFLFRLRVLTRPDIGAKN